MKILSRKVLASLLVFVTATIYIWFGKINGTEWVNLAIASVVGFIAGEGIGAWVTHVKQVKDSEIQPTRLKGTKMTWGIRIKNLFTPSFLAAMVVYAFATALLWFHKLNVTEWTYVAMGMILGYDLLNPLEKFKSYDQ